MQNVKSNKFSFKFLDLDLYLQIKDQLKTGNKTYVFKTKARNSMIYPCFINLVISVYNGKRYIPLKIHRHFVGHKFGEFIPTRKCGHTKKNLASKVQKKTTASLYRQYFENCTYKLSVLEQKNNEEDIQENS